MQITETRLKRIIREELEGILISERTMADIGGDLGSEADELMITGGSNETKMIQLVKLAIGAITGDDPPCPDIGECLASLLTNTLEAGDPRWMKASNRAVRSGSNKEMINTLIHFLREEALNPNEAEEVRTMFVDAGLYDDNAKMSSESDEPALSPNQSRSIYDSVQERFKDKSVSDIEKEIEGIKELVDRGIDEDPANKVQHKALMALLYYQTNGERGISGEVPPGYEMNKNWGKDPDDKDKT